MAHIAHIMLGLAQVRQLGATRPLLGPPNDLDARDVATVNLEGHFGANLGELPAQQDARLDAAPPDANEDAAKRLGGPLGGDDHDVAGAGGLRVVAAKEAGAGARGVHLADLVGVVGGDGVRRRVGEVWVRGLQAVRAGEGGGVDGEAGAEFFGVGGVLAAGAASVEDGYWRERERELVLVGCLLFLR